MYGVCIRDVLYVYTGAEGKAQLAEDLLSLLARWIYLFSGPVVVGVKRLVGNLCDTLYTVFLSLSLFHTPSPTHLPTFLTLSFSRPGEIESVGLVYT